MMNDTRILQSILDGQVLVKKEVSGVREEVRKNGERIDKLNFAELADDAPTVEEFGKLEKRVGKLGKTVASN